MFQDCDIVLVDRRYRDAIPFLRLLGIEHKIPAILQPGQNQLTTEDANATRIITKSRWIVESRHGHLRSIFKFVNKTLNMQHAKYLNNYYCIVGAIINRYYPSIQMQGATPQLAREILRRSLTPN